MIDLQEILFERGPALVVIGLDRRVALANQRAAALFDRSVEALHGRSLADLFADEFFVDAIDGLSSSTTLACRADGSLVPVEITAEAIDDVAGAGSWALWLYDATDRRTTEAAIATALAAEQQARAARERLDRRSHVLLASVSHELRTPVTIVHGLSEVLAGRWDRMDEELRRASIERIAAGADRLRTLVDDLLDLAHLEGDAPPSLVRQPVSVGEALSRTVVKLGRVLEHHDLVPDIDAGLTVRGDPSALERVLECLLANASRFAPRGTAVEVRGRSVGGIVSIDVADHGPGIAADVVDDMFEPFARSGESTDTTPGVGIGLAIARRYVEAMGGTLLLLDDHGEGATFRITLPGGAV